MQLTNNLSIYWKLEIQGQINNFPGVYHQLGRPALVCRRICIWIRNWYDQSTLFSPKCFDSIFLIALLWNPIFGENCNNYPTFDFRLFYIKKFQNHHYKIVLAFYFQLSWIKIKISFSRLCRNNLFPISKFKKLFLSPYKRRSKITEIFLTQQKEF